MDRIPFSAYDFFGYLAAGLLGMAAVDHRFALGLITRKDPPVGWILVAIVALYVLGHVLAHLSAFLWERVLTRSVIGAPESLLLARTAPSRLRRLLVGGYCDPLPFSIADRTRTAAERDLGTQPEPRAAFLQAYAAVRARPDVADRLASFLNLYGFSRNVSFTLVMAGLLFLAPARLLDGEPDVRLGVLALLTGGIMFYRFLKFYRLYTVEILTANLAGSRGSGVTPPRRD